MIIYIKLITKILTYKIILLKDLKSNNCSLDIKNEIQTKVEKIKQINGNIYAYTFNDSIKVYNDKTLKLKGFKTSIYQKETFIRYIRQ